MSPATGRPGEQRRGKGIVGRSKQYISKEGTTKEPESEEPKCTLNPNNPREAEREHRKGNSLNIVRTAATYAQGTEDTALGHTEPK